MTTNSNPLKSSILMSSKSMIAICSGVLAEIAKHVKNKFGAVLHVKS